VRRTGKRSNYAKGRRAERHVARVLRAKGYTSIRLSPGSRGPADIIAFKRFKKVRN
jgi:Holliday junction resolvase